MYNKTKLANIVGYRYEATTTATTQTHEAPCALRLCTGKMLITIETLFILLHVKFHQHSCVILKYITLLFYYSRNINLSFLGAFTEPDLLDIFHSHKLRYVYRSDISNKIHNPHIITTITLCILFLLK